MLECPSTDEYWNNCCVQYQYCQKMRYLCCFEGASFIQMLTILEHKNDLVLSNTQWCTSIWGLKCTFSDSLVLYSVIMMY